MISFIVPYHKNREEHFKYFLVNVFSFYPTCEIIIAEQDDDLPFKRGQLLNLGFKQSKGNFIVFIDIDIRFLERINFEQDLIRFNGPYLPWCHKQDIMEYGPNNFGFLISPRKALLVGYGGMSVFTRSQFKETYGFSNLCSGWGAEDSILNLRIKSGFVRTAGDLFHVEHERCIEKDKYTRCNSKILSTHNERDSSLDSFIHTEADSEYIESFNQVKHFKYKNIRVSNSCEYKKLVDDIYNSRVQ